MRHGTSPIVEPGLQTLVAESVASGKLHATVGLQMRSLMPTSRCFALALPSATSGETNLAYIYRVVEDLVQSLTESASTRPFHTVVIRSTVPPGTVEDVNAILQSAFQDTGPDVGVAMCPEFLREGTGIADFYAPPYTVIGASDLRAIDAVSRLFSFLGSPLRVVHPRTAESLKYACNAFHATKISFANDMGRIFSRLGVDSREVMELFCEDTSLNISPKYLRPGFAFGGSCLPKDIRSLLTWPAPRASTYRCCRAFWRATACPLKRPSTVSWPVAGNKVALLGLSFKPDSDDLRESPYVDLAETLLGKGYEVRIHDPVLNPSSLVGANRQYVESRLPHLKRILTDSPEEAIAGADIAIVSHSTNGSSRRCSRPHRRGFSISMVASGQNSRLWTATRDSPGDSEHRQEAESGATRSATKRPHQPTHDLVNSRKRRRVLILVQNLSVPFDRRVWLECQSLVGAGFEVAVVCPKAPAIRPIPGSTESTCTSIGPMRRADRARHSSLSTPIRSSPRSCSALRASLRGRFIVVQSCNPPDLFWPIGLLFRLLHRSAFVFDHHDLCPELYQSRFPDGNKLVYRALRLMERRTMRTADHVIATNDSYRQIAVERDGVAQSSVTVVRTGPDLARLSRTAAEPDLRRARPHLAAYLGVMGPQDGVDLVLEVADHVVHRLGRRDISFTLIGSGDCFDDLVEQCHRLDLTDYVTFTGRIPDAEVSAILSTADVGISPDPKNPLNDVSTMNKTMEYMAFALPVVAFDLHETRISAGDAAVYATPNDVGEFAQLLVDLIDDEPRRFTMGLAGRARIEHALAWKHQAPRYVEVYEKLIGDLQASHSPVTAGC